MIIANNHEALTPLFKGEHLPVNAHAGLVFDRYLKIWEGKPEDAGRKKELYDPLKKFADDFNRRNDRNAPAPALLAAHHRRLDRAGRILPHQKNVFVVQWRLACGLGGDHPTENGFTFDPVIGVPMITGSAVKGLCRRCAKMMEYGRDRMEILFGPEETASDGGVFPGDLIFHDAFPLDWPRLCVDIVNCHHPQYYAETGGTGEKRRRVPRETESPIPVFFLAVDKDARFAFRYASKSGAKENLKHASELLEKGLDILGTGGKTAVGYGVFKKHAS